MWVFVCAVGQQVLCDFPKACHWSVFLQSAVSMIAEGGFLFFFYLFNHHRKYETAVVYQQVVSLVVIQIIVVINESHLRHFDKEL